MKKIWLCIVAAVLFVGPAVYASTGPDRAGAGVALRARLAFGPAARARLEAQAALELAAEAAVLQAKGQPDLALEAVTEYARMLAGVQAHLQAAVNAGTADAQTVADVRAAHAHGVKVLAGVLARAPAGARPALEALIARQTERLTEIAADQAARAEARLYIGK
jgi:hypothetical protein